MRFLAPVISGARIRLRTAMISIEVKGPGQYLMKALNTVEIEGEEKPALIAETLVMLYERRRTEEGPRLGRQLISSIR